MALFRYLLGFLLIINSQSTLEEAITQLKKDFEESKYLELDIKRKGKTRSGQQRKALQVYCREMAKKLNESGSSYGKFIQHIIRCGLDVDWTEANFKEAFKMYGGGMYPNKIKGKTSNGVPTISTRDLTKKEITELYELVNERMSVMYCVGMIWPSED